MQQYLVRRLLVAVPTLLGISVLIFLALRVLPGDPIAAVFGNEGFFLLSPADQQRFRSSLGLDKPLAGQYLSWMKSVFKGEFGESFWRTNSVRDAIIRKGPVSAQVAIMAVMISWIVGLPVGILSAVRRNSKLDYAARLITVFFLAVPTFWLGMMIVLAGIVWFSWSAPIEYAHLWENPLTNLQITLGPAVVLGLGATAFLARFARSSVLEVIGEDYVRTARSKGLMERVVVWRHVLRNAMIPVVTASGLYLGGLMGGSVAVEQAFGVPGLGLELVRALADRDYAVIQSLVLLYGAIFVLVNLSVDTLYGVIDPRIVYR